MSASGGASGNPVTFSIDAASSAGAVHDLRRSTVSFTGAGTCLVDANQAGNANYASALQAQQSINVGLGAQVISFTSTAPSGATVGGASYAASATGGASGNPVVLTVDAASTAGACTISGSTVSFTGVGTCVVDANQAGNANYAAAVQFRMIVVGKASETLSTSTPSETVGGASGVAVRATGGASGNWSQTLLDRCSTAVGAMNSGSTVQRQMGAASLTPTSLERNYHAASQVQQTIAVGKASQTLAFTSAAPSGETVGAPAMACPRTGGASGNPVTFLIDAACNRRRLHDLWLDRQLHRRGICLVDANQARQCQLHRRRPRFSRRSPSARRSQTLAFTSTAPTRQRSFGGASYGVSASGGASGNPVTLSIDGAFTAGACTISGSTGELHRRGNLPHRRQSGGEHSMIPAATQIQQSVSVGLGAQVIAFTSTAPSAATVGGAAMRSPRPAGPPAIQ